MHGLLHHFFALVIAGGLCLLPAFYAWFNIYANWDPYANTGNIRIAVASLDEGCKDMDGDDVNMGQEILDTLKTQESIGWVFVDSREDAVERVESGDCYAAVVIDTDFSYSMYNAIADHIENPRITYYENEKKNAVATKITDSAVSKLQSTINQSFVKVVSEKLFTETNSISQELEGEDAVESFVEKLETVQKDLEDYDKMIDSFIKGNELLAEASGETNESLTQSEKMIASCVGSLQDGKEDLADTEDSFTRFSAEVNASLTQIQKSIDGIAADIETAKLDDQIDTLTKDVETVQTDASDLSEKMDSLASYLTKVQGNTTALSNTISTLQKAKGLMDDIAAADGVEEDAQDAGSAISTVQQTLSGYSQTVANINTLFTEQISPQVTSMLEEMQKVLERTGKMLTNLSGTLEGMQDIFDGVDTTLSTLNTSLTQLQDVLGQTSTKLAAAIEQIRGASEGEQMDIILNLLAGNPESYSEFFSQPVQVEEHYVYEIANYGSGVAPFYSVLAIWVGMTILVSILKVHVDKNKFPDAKPYEYFLGRYLLFFLLSEIQAIVIVAGDLYLFGVQCKHPAALFLVAMVTSLTFSLLIYSLTISFGDIGKALAVVVMVIQIAGSGGTYPIEALPAFFRAVYIFFPFPYAINAMRECIGGMYQQDLTIYLLKLLVFCAAALLIGLVVRIPFMNLNHFIEKRMEDTKMM
jgi:putative membrane protein